MRYADTFENQTTSDRNLSVKVRSFLTTEDASGVASEYEKQFVLVSDPSNPKPSIGFIYSDGKTAHVPTKYANPLNSSGLSNEFSYTWDHFTVLAKLNKVLHYYFFFFDIHNFSI